jgi:hypothetical protein
MAFAGEAADLSSRPVIVLATSWPRRFAIVPKASRCDVPSHDADREAQSLTKTGLAWALRVDTA